MRTKGEQPKAYQTPYVVVERVMSINAQVVVNLYAPGTRSLNHHDFNATVCQTGVLKLAYGSARDVQRDLGKTIAVQWQCLISSESAKRLPVSLKRKKRVGTMSPKLRLRLPASPLA